MKDRNHWLYLYLKIDPNYAVIKEGKLKKEYELVESKSDQLILINKDLSRNLEMKYRETNENLDDLMNILKNSEDVTLKNESTKQLNKEKVAEIEGKLALIKNLI